MRGIGWECGELAWVCRKSGENAKNAGNQGGDSRNENANLGI